MSTVASTPTSAQGWTTHSSRGYSRMLSLFLVAPLVALLVVGFVYPIAALVKLSLFTPSLDFSAYVRILENPLYASVLLRTFRNGAVITLACLVLGYPVALGMASLKRRTANLTAAAVFIALWSPILVRSYAWIVLLQRKGVVNSLLVNLGVASEPLKLLYNDGAVIMAMTHVLLPFMILPIYAVLRAIPRDYSRAARSLGANPINVFWHVTLPISLPGVFAGSVMCFILSIGFYVTPALVGGPSSLLIATLIGQQATVLLDWPMAAALATILLVTTLVLVFAFRKVLSVSKGFGHVD